LKNKKSNDYLLRKKLFITSYNLKVFYISSKKIHDNLSLSIPVLSFQLLCHPYLISLHNMDKLPYRHLHFDIINCLIKESVFGGYQQSMFKKGVWKLITEQLSLNHCFFVARFLNRMKHKQTHDYLRSYFLYGLNIFSILFELQNGQINKDGSPSKYIPQLLQCHFIFKFSFQYRFVTSYTYYNLFFLEVISNSNPFTKT